MAFRSAIQNELAGGLSFQGPLIDSIDTTRSDRHLRARVEG
ncbi:hypothetical protein RESH_01206 [Rhodopirellula europaea SH398]|uniref:Uncharacterized protein n=1 Tax=Rhodopirellula europaea SH398 TaxID=1263868 RepID=M5S9T2_9BACT|nr:hypothetical protein RESH_01206 [Rhodopirellula europaea SH398]